MTSHLQLGKERNLEFLRRIEIELKRKKPFVANNKKRNFKPSFLVSIYYRIKPESSLENC